MSRGYDFAKVARWFAERSDLILLMFDPSKLGVSCTKEPLNLFQHLSLIPEFCREFNICRPSDLYLLTIFTDISDEFKSVIEELQPHEDKVHCVLNKADMLDTESLMRVYGALLWSMGKVFGGAEVLVLLLLNL